MARPRKATVDYFPHVCNHGQTMFIVEQRYGNDGYAFWFKLLETLGTSEGHYIDLGNPTAWEFLQAKTRLDEGFCTQILDLLAKVGAIDQELWEGRRVVWSQKFVDGIADVYSNRRAETPPRPSFYNQKPHGARVSTDEKPQSKVKESRVEETTPPPTGDPRFAEVVQAWEQSGYGIMSPLAADKLRAYIDVDGVEPGLIVWAIGEGATSKATNHRYVSAILDRCVAAGILTRREAEAQERARSKPRAAQRNPWDGKRVPE